MPSYEKILPEILAHYTSPKARASIEAAFRFAQKAHAGQKRATGEPYIVHPLHTALTLAHMKLDPATIAAALLHDVVEDAGIPQGQLEKEFSKEIAFLVQSVTKLGALKYRGEERHAESLRKMLLAMAEDIRVVLIKFADRLHNMQTLAALEEHPDKQKRIALETLEIYAPIALRLGVSELAKQLEDLAFPFLYPKEYAEISREVKKRYPQRERIIARVKPLVLRELKKENIVPLEVQTRTKHMYSLWKKLQRHQGNWDAIYDLVAARIIVHTTDECYGALGIIHKLWRPFPGRIRDYIALPKTNGYQSLHTTVFGPKGTPIEFQIRTQEMHDHAENGIAAHWAYTELNKPKQGASMRDPKLAWVKQIRAWQKEFTESEEFLESLKIDAFENRIFVFTPQGDVIDLPEGATPVDFAYTIHSNLGNECAGARVGGKMVPLNHELQSGDVVDIIRAKNHTPSSSWLGFVKTSQARTHIKGELRKANQEEHAAKGLDLINQELSALQKTSWEKVSKDKKELLLRAFGMKTLEEILAAVGRGEVSLRRVLKHLVDEKEVFAQRTRPKATPAEARAIPLVSGERGIQTRIAQCCKPTAGEKIIAYVTVQKGASIHKENCKSIRTRSAANARLLPARWQGGQKRSGTVQLEMVTEDRVGLLQDISSTVSNQGINMTATRSEATDNGGAMVRLDVEVRSLEELQILIRKLRAIRSVQTVKRV